MILRPVFLAVLLRRDAEAVLELPVEIGGR